MGGLRRGLVVCAGIVVPLATVLLRRLFSSPALSVASGAGTLIGGFFLRYCIITAGVFTPIALGPLFM